MQRAVAEYCDPTCRTMGPQDQQRPRVDQMTAGRGMQPLLELCLVVVTPRLPLLEHACKTV
eukprot:2902636-Lingulodinium_polyedra.AAC.1